MNRIKRAIHIDFHTMPGIYDFGREWDAAEFAKTLKDAHVTCINAFAPHHSRIQHRFQGISHTFFQY